MTRSGRMGIAIAVLAVGAACAPPQPSAPGPGSDDEPHAARTARRVSIGMLSEPPTIWDITGGRGIVPGIAMLQGLVSAGLSVKDETGALRPQLAEAVPSVENGLWRVLPDGQMETTWRIREGARWQDGSPFTTDDLLFTTRVAEDRDVAVFRHAAFDLIASIEAPDARTISVRWKGPYIGTDRMFSLGSEGYAWPLPQHILGAGFAENKQGFLQLPYWHAEFVGNGAFRLREWSAGSHALLEANGDFALGRPRIDVIEAKFISDPGTLVANVLAGTVHLTTERSVTIEQGGSIQDQWRDGKMVVALAGWTMMYPQLRAPSPAVLGDARLRRALVQTIDRQALADTLMAGVVPVAHSIIAPGQAEYAAVESATARYDYDPRRAGQIVEGLGFTRGADGMFRDSDGHRLEIEIRTTTNALNQKTMAAVAASFQQAGVGAESVLIPVQRLAEAEYRATFPGLELVNQPHGVEGIEGLLHSRSAPLPERGYQAAGSNKNRGQYVNPEYDALMDRYLSTIPMDQRLQILRQIVQHQTDQQLVMGLFYSGDAIMIASRLQNVLPRTTWNVNMWDLTD